MLDMHSAAHKNICPCIFPARRNILQHGMYVDNLLVQSHVAPCEAATQAEAPRTWPSGHTRKGARCRAPSPRTGLRTKGILPAGARTSPCLPCPTTPRSEEWHETASRGREENRASRSKQGRIKERAGGARAFGKMYRVVWRARQSTLRFGRM